MTFTPPPHSSTISSVAHLALNAAKSFKNDYLELSRLLFESQEARNGLHHAGEFGRFRERLLQSLLVNFLPARLGVGDGFVVEAQGGKSTQCDVIIYDREHNPQLSTAGGLAMFPLEVCAAVGEAKSKLSFVEAKAALAKLSATKEMRANMQVNGVPVAPVEELLWARDALQRSPEAEVLTHLNDARSLYVPRTHEWHNLVTFLVCEEIAWPEDCDPAKNFDKAFTEALHDLHLTQPKDFLRQNFILSLRQGLLSYFYVAKGDGDEIRRIPYPYPVQSIHPVPGTEHDGRPSSCGFRWLPANEHYRHIMMFASELTRAASQTPIYPFTPQDHSLDPAAYGFTYFLGC